jgi:uncharacterized cupredoxin-like copper-binding protein
MRKLGVCLAVVLILGTGACKSKEEPKSGAPASPAASPTGANVSSVEVGEYYIRPSSLQVPSGTVTFSVRNAGNLAHNIAIFQDQKKLGEIVNLGPGQTQDLKVDLSQGEYRLICTIPGHEEQGMKGSITVSQPSPGQPSPGQPSPGETGNYMKPCPTAPCLIGSGPKRVVRSR